VRAAALALVALVLTGCETSAEKSAKIEKEVKAQAAKAALTAPRGLSIARVSTRVRALSATVLGGSEATAAIVTLRNSSAATLRDVPIAITVRDSGGASVYTNTTPGLSPSLVRVPLIPAHGQLTWIDDQVQASGGGKPASVSVKVGEAPTVAAAVPRITVTGAHVVEDPSNGPGLQGTATNASSVTQRELIVTAVAVRAGRVVAAGRAVLAEAPPRSQVPFQLFFVGNPAGASIQTSAPATTPG